MIEDGAQLVDVRGPHEWEAGHIPGARHLPLEQLPELVEELDRSRPVIAYCRGGSRSSMAAEALSGAGFEASKLSEGIVGWGEEGLPLEPEDGYVAESGEAAAILEARKRG
jgi:rhodanese-related sulfurtransferase